VVGDLLIEGEAGASENRMITGCMEVVEGARRMFSEISAASMPEAKRALCHATGGRGGCVGGGGVTDRVSGMVVERISGEETCVRGYTMLEEVTCLRAMEVGRCGIIEIRIVPGNPSRRGFSISMKHISGKGIFNMSSDVVEDNMLIMYKVELKSKCWWKRNRVDERCKRGDWGRRGCGEGAIELKSKGVSKSICMGKCVVWKWLLEMLGEGASGGELMRGNV
jgi:hypothetical protein